MSAFLRLNRKKIVYGGIVLVLLGGLFIVGKIVYMHTFQLNSIAAKIVQECGQVSSSDHEACYESVVPALYPRYTVAQIVDIVRVIQVLDTSYTYCHPLGHAIGERVVAENPSKWIDAIHLDPSGLLCAGGYLHGLLSGRFRGDVLTPAELTEALPDFKRACLASGTWDPTVFEQSECYHGMGHLYMYATEDNVLKSAELCDKTIPPALEKEGVRGCYNAIFMQIFDATSPDDKLLLQYLPLQPNSTNAQAFCAMYHNLKLQASCLSRSIDLYPASLAGEEINPFCSREINAVEETYCYVRIYIVMSGTLIGGRTIVSSCSQVEPEHQEACYAMRAISILRQDSTTKASVAINFCTTISPDTFRDSCMTALASESAYEFKKGTPAFDAYCALFSGTAHQVCLHYEKTEYLDIGLGDNVR